MNFSERLNKRIKDLGIRWVDVFNGISASKGIISQWKNHNHIPSSENLIDLAKFLDCDPEWLLFGTGHSPDSPKPKYLEVPLISWVAAGAPMEAKDPYPVGEGQKYIYCPTRHGPHTYALTVRGESMAPDFLEGDIVFVDPDVEPMPKSLVIVRDEESNTATFKQLIYEDDKPLLKAINLHWPSRMAELKTSQKVVGVVIGSYREIANQT